MDSALLRAFGRERLHLGTCAEGQRYRLGFGKRGRLLVGNAMRQKGWNSSFLRGVGVEGLIRNRE